MSDGRPPGLYLLTPRLTDAAAFLPRLEAVLEAVDVACLLLDLDLREASQAKKLVRAIAAPAQRRDAAVLVRDPVLAARAGADGVHIGASERLEADLRAAIDSLRPERIVGVGGLRTRHEAMIAGELEADYLMFGEPSGEHASDPPQDTLERVSWWAEIFTAPCVGYASEIEAAAALARAGADFVALGEAVWSASDPARAAADFVRALEENGVKGS
ncbi:MAG TPA: thiamine phosphate synthase [Beijerinckiaceae bacterium]|nr:thiamine phosphate synthase [Beijerinckiaceae bacterium]